MLGGVLAKDRIERDVTINLVALRGIRGKDAKIAASFIATFSDVEPAMAAVGLVRNEFVAGTSPSVAIGVYRLLCSLDHEDIGA